MEAGRQREEEEGNQGREVNYHSTWANVVHSNQSLYDAYRYPIPLPARNRILPTRTRDFHRTPLSLPTNIAGELPLNMGECGSLSPVPVNYQTTWANVVHSYQTVCDACPDLKISMEPKPTDENTRFSIVPTTAAALLLVLEVNRYNMGLTLDVGHLLMTGENPAQSVAQVNCSNMGLTLDVGHLLMTGENPAQSVAQSVAQEEHSNMGLTLDVGHLLMTGDNLAQGVAQVGEAGKLFGLQLTDFHCRTMYAGHVYFDTFPRNEDPVREAEMNIRVFKSLWRRAAALHGSKVEHFMAAHDALGVMELLEELGM
eukprot:gene28482-31633_t